MSGFGRVYPSLEVRFWQAVDKTPGHGPDGDCWQWTKSKTEHGYGQIGRPRCEGGRVDYAHRVSYEIHYGVDLGRALKTRNLVLHRCDNPSCVNPDHLFIGDFGENTQDMIRKGRKINADQAGEANPAHKLTDEEVREIRSASGSYAAIGEAFGISASWAWKIRNNEAWTHIV